MNKMNISVFGDSVLQGAVTAPDSTELFTVLEDNAFSILQKELNFELYSEAVFGCTVTKMQKKLNRYLKKNPECQIVFLKSGANDCDYNWDEINENPDTFHEPKTPLPVYLKTWEELLETIKNAGITPIVFTMTPMITEKWFDYLTKNHSPENLKKFLKGEIVTLEKNNDLYNEKLIELCNSKNVRMIDIRTMFKNQPSLDEIFCYDGIHPNEKGHRLLAEFVKKEMKWTK